MGILLKTLQCKLIVVLVHAFVCVFDLCLLLTQLSMYIAGCSHMYWIRVGKYWIRVLSSVGLGYGSE